MKLYMEENEMIKINKQQRSDIVIAGAERQGLPDSIQQQTAIGQAGKRIMERLFKMVDLDALERNQQMPVKQSHQ